MRVWKRCSLVTAQALLLLVAASSNALAQDELVAAEPAMTDTGSPIELTAVAELGFLASVFHVIQLSNDGSRIDYVGEGGQDVLFQFTRWSLELGWKEKHAIILLYQPLELVTQEAFDRDLIVNGLVFPAGTPMELTYGFPFWRASYLYDIFEDPEDELSFGGSLQIRNATISFRSLDGTLFRTVRDVGPVPILKMRARTTFDSGFWIGGEIDGFYAPVSVINGSDTEVTGAIVDANLRVGYGFTEQIDSFLNIRWLGGGAVGTGEPDGPSDGYVDNWLHFLTLSVGVRARVL